MSITITFQFDIDQEVITPKGTGYIEAAAIFQSIGKDYNIMYHVVADDSTNWWFESVLLKRNPPATEEVLSDAINRT